MKKLLTIVGARPQFIKAAPVSAALKIADFDELLLHTGQHYDSNLSDIFFDELNIPKPKFSLGVGSASHAQQTGKMLSAIEEVLISESPSAVIVYGDTNSTLAGALAAAKLHIPVVHIEAGLRSFNCHQPEEINRVLTDRLSSLLFVPSQTAISHLKREGISEKYIHMVGDVMFDTVSYFSDKAAGQSKILKSLNLVGKGYILATIHRPESTNEKERLKVIFSALQKAAKNIPVVLPLHPRTKKVLDSELLKGLTVIEPVDFLDMLMLTSHASLVATDSGDLQKEAFYHKKPCVTLRDETEWHELVDLGWNKLISPAHEDKILSAFDSMLNISGLHWKNPYGEGEASLKIANILCQELR